MNFTNNDVKMVQRSISNFLYKNDFQATKELMMLFNRITKENRFLSRSLDSWKDYIKMYDESFYTFLTFKALVDSEKEQSEGMTEEEIKEQIGITIWQLPCGWFIQYV